MAETRTSPVTRLDVHYQDDSAPEKVGGLAVDERGVVHFQYERSWIETRRELSPVRLSLDLDRTLVAAPERRRMHGVFADSLPDAWGMQVMDNALRRRGIDPQRAGPLDRLAFLGDRAMGALTYRPATVTFDAPPRTLSLDHLAQQTDAIAEGTASSGETPLELDDLERAAGSPGGAQPKALISRSTDGKTIIAGGEPPSGFTPYLLKFTPRRAGLGLRTDGGALEHAYALMARDAGVRMPATALLPTGDGRAHFAVERFDRTPTGGRRHVHTFAGMMDRDASDDHDYDELLRLALQLTGDVRSLDEILVRLCFNVAALNDDDHGKNVAFLLDPTDGWRLAPAYDLTYSPNHAGARGMSIDGLEGDVTWSAIATLAARHGIRTPRLRQIRERVEASLTGWERFASASGVPEASIEELSQAFAARRSRLGA